MENMGVVKLVGARKRKPVCISKIPSIPAKMQNLPPPHPHLDGSRSKLKVILDELRVKKNLQTRTPNPSSLHLKTDTFPVTHPAPHPLAHPHPSHGMQTEPLDLSKAAVDLSKTKISPPIPTPSQMKAFYEQYFINQTSTRDKMTRESYCGGLAAMTTDESCDPFDLVEVSMGRENKMGCHGDGGKYKGGKETFKDTFKEQEVGVVTNKGVGEERNHSKKKATENNKPKQRRYRTERPFACPHCPARFTLRSNMERHGKHQHPTVWQRSPSNRVLNKQKLMSSQPSPISVSSPESQQSQVRGLLNNKLKRKLSENSVDKMENNSDQLASVGELLKLGLWKEEDQVSDEEEEQESGEESGSEGEEMFKKQSAYSSAPHKISCPHCSRRFPWTSSLRRHLLTHTGQKPYQCSKCPLLFTTKSNCDRHLARKHKEGMELGEEQEEEEEDEDDEEESGLVCSGNNEPMFRCHICDDTPTPTTTPTCSTSRAQVLAHMEMMHKEIYNEFKEKGLIEDKNSEPVPEEVGVVVACDHGNRKVLCVFCLRRFWSVEDLRRHIRSHTGERPFSCKCCGRRFTLKHSMMRHQKKH